MPKQSKQSKRPLIKQFRVRGSQFAVRSSGMIIALVPLETKRTNRTNGTTYYYQEGMTMNNDKWSDIAANLTLARYILNSAIGEIDNILSQIEAGQINGDKRLYDLMNSTIKSIMDVSNDISDISVDIPEIFMRLKQQQQDKLPSFYSNDNCPEMVNPEMIMRLTQQIVIADKTN